MKRIAIDCRPLVGHRTGIGRYLYELLKELAGRNDDIQFYLYAPKEIDLPKECRNDSRFCIRIKRFRPAIVWLHLIVPYWIVKDQIDVFWGPNYALPFLSLKKYRAVITIHDATFARFPETMHWVTRIHNKWMLPLYIKRADLILTDSLFSKEEVKEVLGVSLQKIRVVHLAATKSGSVPTGTSNSQKRYVLSVCTIEPRKNIESLVYAYSRLPQAIRDEYSLVLVGALGWGNLVPQEWFSKYVVKSTASHYGYVNEADLHSFYANATVFVYPSKYEGFGLPVLEAMCYGVPVLCSYSSALGEVTATTALYCDPEAVEDITLKLRLLLEDDKLRQRLSFLGEKRSKQFNWAKSTDATLRYLLGSDKYVDTP